MIKRVLCILLAALILLSLAACASSDKNADVTPPAATDAPTEPLTEPVTEIPTDHVAKIPTEPVTETPTEPVTDAPEPVTEAPTEPVTEAPTEPVTEAPTEPATEQPPEVIPEEPEEPTDHDSMLQWLVGVWNYFPVDEDAVDSPEIDGIPGLTIQLMEDGSFYAIRHSDNAQCTGSWTLDWFYADEDECPDWLLFQVEDADEGMEVIGDFWIENWAVCTGTDRLDLIQVNNGDSIFLNDYDVYFEVLVRGSFDPDAQGEAPKTDAEFVGIVWDVRGEGTELWITEVSSENFSVTVGSRRASRYLIAADAELVWPVNVFNQGACPAALRTNAAGEIVFLDWASVEEEGG